MIPPLPLLLLNALVAAAVILAILYTFAIFVRCALEVHQLKVDTQNLRISYIQRIRDLRDSSEGPQTLMVEIIEDGDPAESGGVEATAAAA